MNDPTPLIIANLKANKTWEEVSTWLDMVGPKTNEFAATIVFAPSHPFLAACSHKIKSTNWKIKLASQDISQFEQGAYTGEVAATQISSLCQYAIIGHSERRQNFAEDDETLSLKIQNAQKANIWPIFCIQDENTIVPKGVEIIAYEPIAAIGTGNPDTPQNAQNVALKIKQKGQYTVIYGGSVTPEIAQNFLKNGIIDGLLVATSSLNPQTFIQVIESATI